MKNQAQQVIDLEGMVEFSPVAEEIYISLGTLYTNPDGSEVWCLYHPEKYGLRRFEENTPEIWEKLWQ